MARHEFGIMQIPPKSGERYDEYEPEKYHCISVDDDFIEPLTWKVSDIDCYAHTVDIPMKGLAYCGITLIPPESLSEFISISGEDEKLAELTKLMLEAQKQNKFVIHYGL